MKIVLSAHYDHARPVLNIKMDDKNLCGLVDNFAGVFTAYNAARRTGATVYYTNFEELEFDGAIDVANKLDKEDTIVIVVDAVQSWETEGKDVTIANVYNMDLTPYLDGLKDRINFVPGEWEPDRDESFVYGKTFGFKSFYFGVPILKKYHDTDNMTSLETIDKASDVLVQLIKRLRVSETVNQKKVHFTPLFKQSTI